uniref:Peptidase_M13 domain-containing protein n=1 Tax=Panagrellus redivivus TaxID=6233 RepID=A0A7E4VS71_PANRE
MFIEAVSNMKEVMGQWKVSQESVKRIANDIMNIELGLFGVRCPEDQSIQPAQQVADITMSINELQNYTTFGIGKYVKLYLKSATRGFDIRLNDVKILVSPDTLVNLNNFAATLSDDKFLQYIYFTSLSSLLKNQPSEDCFDLMLPFSPIKSRMYRAYKRHGLREVEGDIIEYVNQHAYFLIRNKFAPFLKDMLESQDWARHDNETLRWIGNKLTTIQYYININDKILINGWLDIYYQQLQFEQNDNFLDMHFKVLRFLKYKNDMRLLFSSAVTKDHPDYLIDSDDYKVLENLVHVFDFTLYAQSFPLTRRYMSLSLGGGSVFSPIFRDMVRYFDKDLTYTHGKNTVDKKVPVLAVKKFEKLARCVAGQDNELNALSNYRNMEDVNVDRMISKIMTDIGGLEVSYQYYIRKFDDTSEKPMHDIRLRELTNEKLFFVGFAGSFCKKQTDAEIADVLRNGGLPNEARVKVTLRNLPAFANAFKCPASSEYVAEQRCRVLANCN